MTLECRITEGVSLHIGPRVAANLLPSGPLKLEKGQGGAKSARPRKCNGASGLLLLPLHLAEPTQMVPQVECQLIFPAEMEHDGMHCHVRPPTWTNGGPQTTECIRSQPLEGEGHLRDHQLLEQACGTVLPCTHGCMKPKCRHAEYLLS